MGQAITRSACRIWGARGFGEVSEKEGVTGQQGYEEVGLRCRDTGKPTKKGVSWTGFDGKEGKWYKKEKLLQNKEEPNKRNQPRRTSKRNQGKRAQKRKQEKEKTTRQYRGKSDTGGWEDSSLTLRMTAESRGELSE